MLMIRENPFSSRFVQPGAIPFFFPSGIDTPQVLARLRSNEWWGQVIGPHGTGKSTFIATLLPQLVDEGLRPVWYTLRDRIVTLPGFQPARLGLDSNAVLIIDGFEQLSPWRRWLLRRACRRSRSGLLVTAHQSVGLPELHRTSVDAELARSVLSHLNRDGQSPVGETELFQSLTRHHGNLREALFDLYDRHEQLVRRRLG